MIWSPPPRPQRSPGPVAGPKTSDPWRSRRRAYRREVPPMPKLTEKKIMDLTPKSTGFTYTYIYIYTLVYIYIYTI